MGCGLARAKVERRATEDRIANFMMEMWGKRFTRDGVPLHGGLYIRFGGNGRAQACHKEGADYVIGTAGKGT